MAAIGLVRPWPMGLAPGQLMLTPSALISRLSTRRITALVGPVSPSAVWYTSYLESSPILIPMPELGSKSN